MELQFKNGSLTRQELSLSQFQAIDYLLKRIPDMWLCGSRLFIPFGELPQPCDVDLYCEDTDSAHDALCAYGFKQRDCSELYEDDGFKYLYEMSGVQVILRDNPQVYNTAFSMLAPVFYRYVWKRSPLMENCDYSARKIMTAGILTVLQQYIEAMDCLKNGAGIRAEQDFAAFFAGSVLDRETFKNELGKVLAALRSHAASKSSQTCEVLRP